MIRPVLAPALAALCLLALPSAAAAADLGTIIRANAGREASFVQKFTPRGFKKEQVERGKVLFGSAPQMRWTYSGPEKKVFVFDGSTSWLYTPSDRQVIVTRLRPEQRRSIPLAFLWDENAARDFEIKTSRSGRSSVLDLTPRAADSQIRSAQVVALADGTLQSLSWVDRQGNRNVFEFSGFRKATPAAGSFRFSPPSGTNVVENQE